MIGIGFIFAAIIIFGIYGAQKEIYCINVCMVILSAIRVFGSFVNENLVKLMINVGLTVLLVYYSYLIKYEEIIVNQSDNIELRENNPNVNTGNIMKHNSKQYVSEK
jgi:hypothetical protein